MTDNIKKLIEANKWRPIEEAPRDGTSILVRVQDGVQFVAQWDFDGNWQYAEWEEERDSLVLAASATIMRSLIIHKPTHFRPLPDDRLAEVCEVLLDALKEIDNGSPNYDGRYMGVAEQALSCANEMAGGTK